MSVWTWQDERVDMASHVPTLSHYPQLPWSSVDAWFHPYQGASLFSHSQEPKFVEVSTAFETQAETLLRSKSSSQISSAQAEQMSVRKHRGTKGKPFLVRAVYLNKETGAFFLSLQGKDLFVSHSSLGHSAVPMKRQVLIVDLLQAPRNVYVDCNMAE